MELSRRRAIHLGMLGTVGAMIGGTAACSTSTSGGSGGGTNSIDFWYWQDGLSEKVVDDAVKRFTSVSLKPQQIGGDFRQKLTTTMASGAFVPGITGIKGEDFASFTPQADRFVNLLDHGADKLAGQYLSWKWKKGMTKDGKLIGFPIDIGPTAHFYRRDIFAKAGLPTDPDKVGAQMSTWDDYFAAGVELKKAVPTAHMVSEAWSVYNVAVSAAPARYIDENEHFIGDQDHIHTAWNYAIKAIRLGLDAKVQSGSTDWNAGLANGSLPSQTGAAWGAADIQSGAKNTSGNWGVALSPGGSGNIGGSFLAITKECSKPDVAFEIISWILSPENQARGFTDSALFPSTPATYAMPALTAPDPFFGGQVTIQVLGQAAQKIPVQYESPNDQAVSAPYQNELTNVESNGKDPDAAWADAITEAKKIGQRLGVS